MTELHIVKHCSPTLANMKTGSLFNCSYECENLLKSQIRGFNKLLIPLGVRVIPIKIENGRALIYIYRPKKLEKDFKNELTIDLLKENGYVCNQTDKCLVQLINKLKNSVDFPHEIGLFLGYPPEDVKAFIDNNGQNCKHVGVWKVYSNEQEALKIFEKYRKCTEVYYRKCSQGLPLKRLTVAG